MGWKQGWELYMILCIWRVQGLVGSNQHWQNSSLSLLICFNDGRAKSSPMQLHIWDCCATTIRQGEIELDAVLPVIRSSAKELSGLPHKFSKFSGAVTLPSLGWNAEKISFDRARFEHGCLFNKYGNIVIACYWTCPLLVRGRSPLRCYHRFEWKQVSGGLSHSGTGKVSKYKRSLVLIEYFITWKWSAYININRIVHVILFFFF